MKCFVDVFKVSYLWNKRSSNATSVGLNIPSKTKGKIFSIKNFFIDKNSFLWLGKEYTAFPNELISMATENSNVSSKIFYSLFIEIIKRELIIGKKFPQLIIKYSLLWKVKIAVPIESR